MIGRNTNGSGAVGLAYRAPWRTALGMVIMLAAAAAGAIDDHPPFEDPARQARYERLTNELRCVKCQNNNIADSNADIARDLRREVHEMIEAGRSDREILDFMVSRYGDFVLYRPAFKPSNYLLWFAPALAMIVGLVVLLRIIRSRAALLDDDDEVPGGAHAGTEADGNRGSAA